MKEVESMVSYRPPFTITNSMVSLVSEISEKIGRLDRYQRLDAKPQLRCNNRIRSIHSSLAIEANSLSMEAVRGVIDGKTVIGSEKEIQEVKNAYRAYDELCRFDPFSIDELKRLHGIMTYLTVDESGQFRRGEEGIFDGDCCIFMAPPAMRVSGLMEDLFSWMKEARGTCICSFFPRYFIMSLCLSTRLRMGTGAWHDSGRQACSANGITYSNIFRLRAGFMRFSPNTMKQSPNATAKAIRTAS